MPASLNFQLPPIEQTWRMMREIRQKVYGLLSAYPADLREQAAMAASELAENTIKYGAVSPALPPPTLAVELVEHHLILESHNGVDDPARIEAALAIVAALQAAASAGDLYEQRLLELIDAPPTSGSRLGLLRIAHEGGFQLEATYSGALLTIKAKRRLGDG